MQAQEIPLGSKVTKKTGEKEYRITDRIKIYGDAIAQKELCADDGTRFLISDVGNVNIIAGNSEIVWIVSDDDLLSYMDGRVNGPPK